MSPLRIGKFFWFVRRATGHFVLAFPRRYTRAIARFENEQEDLVSMNTCYFIKCRFLFFCTYGRCSCIIHTLWCSIAEPLNVSAWHSISVSTTQMWRTASDKRTIGHSRSRRVKKVGAWAGVRYLPVMEHAAAVFAPIFS